LSSDGIPPADSGHGRPTVTRHPTAGWVKLGTVLAIVAAEITEGVLHPVLAVGLGIADVCIPLIAGLTVFVVVVRGSAQTVDRVFRLLRWVTNRPEPAFPKTSGPRPRQTVTWISHGADGVGQANRDQVGNVAMEGAGRHRRQDGSDPAGLTRSGLPKKGVEQPSAPARRARPPRAVDRAGHAATVQPSQCRLLSPVAASAETAAMHQVSTLSDGTTPSSALATGDASPAPPWIRSVPTLRSDRGEGSSRLGPCQRRSPSHLVVSNEVMRITGQRPATNRPRPGQRVPCPVHRLRGRLRRRIAPRRPHSLHVPARRKRRGRPVLATRTRVANLPGLRP